MSKYLTLLLIFTPSCATFADDVCKDQSAAYIRYLYALEDSGLPVSSPLSVSRFCELTEEQRNAILSRLLNIIYRLWQLKQSEGVLNIPNLRTELELDL